YSVVQHRLETFLATAGGSDPLGYGVPGWVERDFRAYLRCGILAHGFARIRCDACAAERLVAFSCKGRGRLPLLQCPPQAITPRNKLRGGPRWRWPPTSPTTSCRRCPSARWVLSLPKRIRPFLPHDPRLAGDVLRVLLRAIRTALRRASPPAPGNAQLGAVSFQHRFGSALNPHFHFHVVVLDGVFSDHDDGAVSFHEATHLSADDVQRLQRTPAASGAPPVPATRTPRRPHRRGHAHLAGQRRLQSGRLRPNPCGSDSAGRERLLRYCARPPFARERLRIERHVEGHEHRSATASPGEAGIRQVLYHPARPTRDGRSVLALSPLEFSPPSAASSRHPASTATATTASSHRTHGYVSRSSPSVATTARRRGDTATSAASDDLRHGTGTAGSDAPECNAPDLPVSPQRAAARSRWARLLARTYEVFPLTCPADPGFDFDQTPAYDPTEPEPVPDFDFDQSAGA
ncbi:MAG: transposase, partial [Solirubrobacterales bacterium]